MDILRCKLETSVMPDALVMRTISDVIDSPPKFNADYKNKFMPTDAIGLEVLLLASSLLTNQTYIFDTSGSRSADELLQGWQDMCVASDGYNCSKRIAHLRKIDPDILTNPNAGGSQHRDRSQSAKR
ncbi:unnamed protein product [Rotaria sordida]|uniref:Uncharacterized protein n=1 Tax=Rotaria sordida TaxID=392033 RepID=A0A815VCN6_9BILA|nr:unnamed protein product [Rotaria sordida]CAF1664478.1 unnamed protein product [Rotaria sordida]